MNETIDVMCFGTIDIFTDDAVDLKISLRDENESWTADWLLSPDESKLLRKALKKAEKAVKSGE